MVTEATMRRVLVRIVDNRGSWQEVGYTIASEAIRRPVTFRTRVGGPDAAPSEATLDGLALIGEGGKEGHLSIEPIARMLGQQVLKIARTVELLWLPVTAHRTDVVDLWTIECVPLVSWFTLSQRTDEAILRLAGVDADTGEILLPPPEFRCHACGGHGRVAGASPAASDALTCPLCNGTGVQR
ncbi:hypothetical protein [Mycobacterium phage Weirdo19]|uniref:Uncharacterized protein n=1 Tax=Mycobacterium phage Weirdo19 TaxID=2601610 RepID=A0A6M2YSX5_9CAUD|nr:hypothetical protein KDJ11_gp69 [Mycobacterium phage Weirdo19]QEA10837.1 hypothetical protein [Mycobacterium phage Weirdo19]